MKQVVAVLTLAMLAFQIPIGAHAQIRAANGGHRGALIVSPNPVQDGDTVSILGAGFRPFATVQVNPGVPGAPIQTVSISNNGTFLTSFGLRQGTPAGQYQVTAFSGGILYATAHLTVKPRLHMRLFVLPAEARPGQILTVEGRAFPHNSVARVDLLIPVNGPPVQQFVHTNGSGDFTTRFVLPGYASSGRHTVVAQVAPQPPVLAHFNVTAQGAIQAYVAPNPVGRGTWSQVIVTGFGPFTSLTVEVLLPQPQRFNVQTDSRGYLGLRFFVPLHTGPGRYRITIQNGFQLPYEATFVVTPGAG